MDRFMAQIYFRTKRISLFQPTKQLLKTGQDPESAELNLRANQLANSSKLLLVENQISS